MSQTYKYNLAALMDMWWRHLLEWDKPLVSEVTISFFKKNEKKVTATCW